MSSEELVFHGADGEEAEKFIRSVNKVAKAAGKLRDNDWIIEEVSVAFDGHALRWYIELDDETRNDWLRLQRAILQKYPPALRNPSGIIPVPAAVPAHPNPVAAPPARSEDFYIRVLYGQSSKTMYVGSLSTGIGYVVETRQAAVQVRHERSTGLLTLVNPKGPSPRDTVCLSGIFITRGFSGSSSNLAFESRGSGENPWPKATSIVVEYRWEVNDSMILAPRRAGVDGTPTVGGFYLTRAMFGGGDLIRHTFSDFTEPESITLKLELVRP